MKKLTSRERFEAVFERAYGIVLLNRNGNGYALAWADGAWWGWLLAQRDGKRRAKR